MHLCNLHLFFWLHKCFYLEKKLKTLSVCSHQPLKMKQIPCLILIFFYLTPLVSCFGNPFETEIIHKVNYALFHKETNWERCVLITESNHWSPNYPKVQLTSKSFADCEIIETHSKACHIFNKLLSLTDKTFLDLKNFFRKDLFCSLFLTDDNVFNNFSSYLKLREWTKHLVDSGVIYIGHTEPKEHTLQLTKSVPRHFISYHLLTEVI